MICYDTCGAFSLFVYVWYVMVLVVSFRLYGNTVPVVCGLGAPHETKEGAVSTFRQQRLFVPQIGVALFRKASIILLETSGITPLKYNLV